MKFTCEKELLVSAISTTAHTVSTKCAIAALEGIHLCADHTLTLTGYNLETGITVSVPAEITESGSCIMPAHLFFDIIRKLPDETVCVTVDDQYKVSIRGGISSFVISAASPEDYPGLPEMKESKGFELPQKDLKKMINGTIFSVADNQVRPIQTGCLIEVSEDAIIMIAVDGFRLALRRYRPETPTGHAVKFVAPGAALKELEKILSDTENPVLVIPGSQYLLFRIGNATLICRTMEGEFLDWRRVLPETTPISLCVNVEDITACIERVSLIVSEKIKSPVRCLFGNNTVDFSTLTSMGTAHDVCSSAGDGKDLEIGFNCRYLMEALRAVDQAEISLGLTSNLNPILMTPCDGCDQFVYMVLPVRLKAGEVG